MDDKLALTHEVTGLVVQAVNSLVASYRVSGEISKGKLKNLRIRIEEFNALERASAISAVADKHIDTIANIYTSIDRKNLEGCALEFAMRQAKLAADGLENSMRIMIERMS